jgi:hypothetical protein
MMISNRQQAIGKRNLLGLMNYWYTKSRYSLLITYYLLLITYYLLLITYYLLLITYYLLLKKTVSFVACPLTNLY